jgi:hypothetical protein
MTDIELGSHKQNEDGKLTSGIPLSDANPGVNGAQKPFERNFGTHEIIETDSKGEPTCTIGPNCKLSNLPASKSLQGSFSSCQISCLPSRPSF